VAAVRIVTFAEHAVEGSRKPWTSNPVERLMGEVSKRCKNQWMRWTAEGFPKRHSNLWLVKHADPEYYQAFLTNCSNVRPKQQSTVTSQLRVPAAKSRLLCTTRRPIVYPDFDIIL